MGRQNWGGQQSGVPGCGQVDDYGGIHRLIVHSAHGRIHIGGGPVCHDSIPWKVSRHLSDHYLELYGGYGSYRYSAIEGGKYLGQAMTALKVGSFYLSNGSDNRSF